jgi:hypothetical protein
VKTTAPLFEIEDRVVARPLRRVAPIAVEASEDNLTGVAGIALVGELLDRLGLVEVADRHHLRPIGPGGYSGGECYRPVVELQLAGGDFLSDVPPSSMRRHGACGAATRWPPTRRSSASSLVRTLVAPCGPRR